MSFSKILWLSVGLLLGAQSAYAILQTSDPKKSKGGSTLVSTAGSNQASVTSGSASAEANAGKKTRLRLKPRHPDWAAAAQAAGPKTAVDESAPMTTNAPPEGPDPFSFRRTKLANPHAIRPEGESPVIEQVSGPPNNFRTQYMKVKNIKPARTTLTVNT